MGVKLERKRHCEVGVREVVGGKRCYSAVWGCECRGGAWENGGWVGGVVGPLYGVAVLSRVICFYVSVETGLSGQRRMIVARLAWSVAFLTAGAEAATMLGVWIPGLAAPPVGSTTPRPYRLRCPRCGTGQEAVTGEHHCSGCGLKIQVDVA